MKYSKVILFVSTVCGLLSICGYADCRKGSSNVGAGLAEPRFKEAASMPVTFQNQAPLKSYLEFASIPQMYQGYMIPGSFQAKAPGQVEPDFRKSVR